MTPLAAYALAGAMATCLGGYLVHMAETSALCRWGAFLAVFGGAVAGICAGVWRHP